MNKMSNLVGFSGTNSKGFPEHLSIDQLGQFDHQSGTQNDPLVENPDSLLDIITQSLPDFSSHELDQLNMALSDSDISSCLQSQHITPEGDPELQDFICEMSTLLPEVCSERITKWSDLLGAIQLSPQKHFKQQESSEYLRLSKLLPDHLNLLCGPLLEDDEDWQTLLSPHYHDLPTTSNSKLSKKQDTRATPFDETKESIANLFQHYKLTDYCQKKPPDPGPAASSLNAYGDLSNTTFEGSESDEEIDVVTVDEDDKDNCRAKLLYDDCSAARCNPVTKVWFSKRAIHLNALKKLSTHLEQNTLENCQTTKFLDISKPALEAADMNSLLEQFEASADTNSSLQHAQIVPIADVEAYSDTASPSSRKIMSRDSSPSSIIDRIKSSTLNKKGIVLIKPEDALQSKKSNKGSNSVELQVKHQRLSVTEVGKHSSESQHPVSFYNALDHDYCGISKIPDYLIQLSPPKNSFRNAVKGFTEPSVQVVRPFQKPPETENEVFVADKIDTAKTCEKLPGYLTDVSRITFCKKTEEKSLSKLPGDNNVQVEKKKDFTSIYTEKSKKSSSFNKPVASRVRSRSMRRSNSRTSSSSSSPVNRRRRKHRSQSSHSSVNSRFDKSCSRSRSRSSSYSSRSRSPSPVKYRRRCSRSRNSWNHKSRPHFPSWNRGYHRYYQRPRSRSPREYFVRSSSKEKMSVQERRKKKFLEVEERRVIYIGNIPEGTTRTDLRQRFCKFGPIEEVSVHLRDHGDNYGFVTFHNRSDAFEALEHGNDDASYPKVDLCFGGRRQFCKSSYADLDSQAQHSAQKPFRNQNIDFDSLLQAAKANVQYK